MKSIKTTLTSLLRVQYFLLILPVALALWGAINMSGFCWSEGRHLSDDEIFHRVIKTEYLESEFLSLSVIQRKSGEQNIQKHIKYKSLEEFLKLNPDCCAFYNGFSLGNKRVDSGSHKRLPSFYHRFFGIAWRAIAVRYKVFYLNHEGIKKFVSYGFTSWTNSCGVHVHAPLKYIVG